MDEDIKKLIIQYYWLSGSIKSTALEFEIPEKTVVEILNESVR